MSTRKSELSLDQINSRIKQEICYQTLEELTDEKLMFKYKESESVKKNIKILADILDEENIDSKKKQKILDKYFLRLIPAGTKGVIRGMKFNELVKTKIINLELDVERFEIRFEKICDIHVTSEIPDWYILDKKTKKILIGMNQLDLWSGGHQINRGSKYIENNIHNTETSKLLCVICNEKQFKTKRSKVFNIFQIGFTNNTLCYLNNLPTIINSYFNLITD